ncbi:DUF4173 domain-containing protein [Streptomyces sp. TRM66268-LWL]|uniref:DUF4173 domain-containing protein n=1 Tax=Streptomyces polyasparticus TaxID=2767826 RepID=A0ABR7SUL4_9ACTN|nr:DUF4173 domain-containing protein [Streptomyces polyasparticus]MBC9718345.1 DUF4173 domain-containing protein [Streptomyces polyasparticus]
MSDTPSIPESESEPEPDPEHVREASGAPAEEPQDAVPPARTPAEAAVARGAAPPPRTKAASVSPGATWGTHQRPPSVFDGITAADAAPVRTATLVAALAAGVLSALLLADGVAVNLLIVAVPLALAAYFAAQAAGRLPRGWTLAWAAGGLALLAVPALRDADWPSFLAVAAAFGLGSLALHGARRWPGVLLNPLGLVGAVGPGTVWAWRGLRARAGGPRGSLAPIVRAVAVAIVLLLVFGGLFAAADSTFAELLGSLLPDSDLSDGPLRFLLFALGVIGAVAAAYTAAAPLRWDRIEVKPGRARGRVEWALPLVVLNLLFAVFNVIQLAVLFGGYKAALKDGLTYSEYARQGFWQLLFATLLTLAVIAVALRWSPRDGQRDRTLVRAVLGTLCVMTLIVVASALRRMQMYVDAYGLTRLRISVTAMELWLGLVIVLIMAAGVWGARWLPRAVIASAAGGVLVFGLVSPDGMVAEQNVQRYLDTKKFDVYYVSGLSADAVPALDKLPEPVRSCALAPLMQSLGEDEAPWYAMSYGESRARSIIAERPLREGVDCYDLDVIDTGTDRSEY